MAAQLQKLLQHRQAGINISAQADETDVRFGWFVLGHWSLGPV